jgi:chemotaxis protein methyltransferase CheR
LSSAASAGLSEAGLLRFAELIEARLGLRFDSSSLEELTVILRARMRALRCAATDAYLQRLEAAESMNEELRELAAKLTTGETYFFRSPEQFTVFTGVALPRLVRTQPARQIRILSAGCATGEEPYSLAMTLRELGESAPAHFSIVGLDVNPESIAKARRARYSAWSMRSMPPGCLKRYFRRERNQFLLDERVRAMVRFEERNLALEDYDFWRPCSFDLIFCRNVTMYLSVRALGEVVARFARVLTPDGFLFLSHAEPLRGLSQAFQVEHAHGAYYYVLRDPNPSLARKIAVPAPGSSTSNTVPMLASPRTRDSLVTAALPASVRDAECSSASFINSPSPALRVSEAIAPLPGLKGGAELQPSLSRSAALMEAERFDEALATLEALPPESRDDPDVLLLMAIILMELGKLEGAAQVCATLIVLNDLNATAHYLNALCHEQSGRRPEAVESYHLGVYLDREFSLPHLRLGLIFRREGDFRSARRELQNAAILLEREDPARIALFGGGFSRGTLINLCASELRLCEGPN